MDADAFVVLRELLPCLALPPEFEVGWTLRLDDAERGTRRADALVRLAEAGLVVGRRDAWRLHPLVVAALAVQAAPHVGVQVHTWSTGSTLVACVALSTPSPGSGRGGSTLARARRGDHDGPMVEVSAFDSREAVPEVLRLVTEGASPGGPHAGNGDRRPFEAEMHACYAFACAVRDGATQNVLSALVPGLPAVAGVPGVPGVPGAARVPAGPGGDGRDALRQLIGAPRAGLHVMVTSSAPEAHPARAIRWCEEWLADDGGWWRLTLRRESEPQPGPVDMLRFEPVGIDDLRRGLGFVLAGALGVAGSAGLSGVGGVLGAAAASRG